MIIETIDLKISYRVQTNSLIDMPDDVYEEINEATKDSAFLYDGCKFQKAYQWVCDNVQENEAYDWDCIVDEIIAKEVK